MGIPLWKSLAFFLTIVVFSVKLFPSERQIGLYYAKAQYLERARFYLARQFYQDPGDIQNTLRYLKSLAYNDEDELFEHIGIKAVRLNPYCIELYYVMARFYEDHMRDDKASGYWEEIVRLSPKDTDTRTKLLSYYILAKETEKLMRYDAAEIARGNAPVDTYHQLGRLYCLKNMPREAEKIYLALLQKYPQDALAKIRLSELYEFTGDFDTAIRYFRMMVQENPQNKDYALRYAGLLMNHGAPEEAMSFIEKSVEQFPDDQNLLILLSDLFVSQKQTDKAIALLEAMYARNPNQSGILKSLGALYFDAKNYEKAKEMLERYHRKEDGDYHTHHILGDVLAALGEKNGSRREYEKALKLIRENE
ncbi:MAG: tetratricopeptide repeat protein [Candidatus Omnitrophica bacterium]|nr:tetratricopeptide repeat protein [Candidatus Omnitrophota bacterium]MDD5670605.1 tetratricopeptide repeat protein [Candidatus Omnitrophota bacterium]